MGEEGFGKMARAQTDFMREGGRGSFIAANVCVTLERGHALETFKRFSAVLRGLLPCRHLCLLLQPGFPFLFYAVTF